MEESQSARRSGRVSRKTSKAFSAGSQAASKKSKTSTFTSKYCASVNSDGTDELAEAKDDDIDMLSANFSCSRTSSRTYGRRKRVVTKPVEDNDLLDQGPPTRTISPLKRAASASFDNEEPQKKKLKHEASANGLSVTRSVQTHSVEIEEVSTPRKLTMKKVLVGKKNEEDSPSKAAIIRAAQRTETESARRRLFIQQTPTKESILDSPVTTPSKSLVGTPRTPRSKSTVTVPFCAVTSAELCEAKKSLMRRLTNRDRPTLQNLDEQYRVVHTLFKEAILRAESNSILLIGPAASGKSLVIETALSAFTEHEKEFTVVRLDGSMQTDDKAALRAIARQLQPAADHDAIAATDLMTALLAILSDPAEFGETEESISIIIVLDNFDRFCEQPRQTLLYNLFDIAQSKKAPICVIGATRRVDAFESLEKRVKSRFSHRIVQLHQPQSLKEFRELAMSALTLASTTEYAKIWNNYIQTNTELDRFIEFTFLISKDVRELWTKLIVPICSISIEAPFPLFTTIYSQIIPRLPQHPPAPQYTTFSTTIGSKLESTLPSLSTLEMSLLIAASRIDTKDQKVNFSTTFNEYRQLSQKANITQKLNGVTNLRSYGKIICRGAWEKLLKTGLVIAGRGEYKSAIVDTTLLDLSKSAKGHRGFNSSMNTWIQL